MEYYETPEGGWEVAFRCGNGFLDELIVSCKDRSVAKSFTDRLVSGYYEATLKGSAKPGAYIDKVIVRRNGSIDISGVFYKREFSDSEKQLTDYMTITVYPNDDTVYAGMFYRELPDPESLPATAVVQSS
ncbi:MAG: hypothetical protein Q4A32_06535 [Lachnospiraceae bacterium]|nr:hypothetical protein [Lachnospiraceae bacterium]